MKEMIDILKQRILDLETRVNGPNNIITLSEIRSEIKAYHDVIVMLEAALK